MEAAAAEIAVLGSSVVLLPAQISAQSGARLDPGPKNLSGARDEKRMSRSVLAGRLPRALRNLLETYPAFARGGLSR